MNSINDIFQPFKDKIDEKAAKAVNSGEYGKATKVAAETKDFSASAGVPDVDKKEVRRNLKSRLLRQLPSC